MATYQFTHQTMPTPEQFALLLKEGSTNNYFLFDFDQIDRRTKQMTPILIIQIVNRIVQQFQPNKIILFGSWANNKVTPESDLDLLVIIDDSHSLAPLKRRNRFGKLLELFRYCLFSLDAIILTISEVKQLQITNEGEWDLVLEILKEGKTIYDSEQKTERPCSTAN